MSFSRVKPGGWALNEKLTSGQINQLDINVSNAVDKTGDTVPGIITLDSGARIDVGNGASVRLLLGAEIACLSGSQITVAAGSGIQIVDGFITALVGSTTNFQCPLNANGGLVSTTGSFSGLATFASGVNISGLTNALGALTVAGATTTNGIMTTNAAVTHAAAVTCQSGLAVSAGVVDIQGGVAVLIDGGAGLTHANTSTQTHSGGSTETHASGSSDTYQSGSTLTFAPASNITVNARPTLSAGIDVTAGLVATSATTVVDLDGTVTVKGASNRILLDERSIFRTMPYSVSRYKSSQWEDDPMVVDVLTTTVVGAACEIALDLPNGCEIDTVTVWYRTVSGHVLFPAQMPILTLSKRVIGSFVSTTLAQKAQVPSDFASDIANYSGITSTISVTNVGVIVNRATSHYTVRFQTEDGVNAIVGTRYFGMTVTYKVSRYDEGR